MTVIYIFLLATLFALTSAGSFGFCPKYKIILVRDTANKAGGLQHAVNKYRRLLGDPDNLNERGPLFKGRREVRNPPFALFTLRILPDWLTNP